MVEIFKQQISKIHDTLDELPLKFRRIEEQVDDNIAKTQEKAEIKLQQIEGHLNELTFDFEEQKDKGKKDKKYMNDQVEVVQKTIWKF